MYVKSNESVRFFPANICIIAAVDVLKMRFDFLRDYIDRFFTCKFIRF